VWSQNKIRLEVDQKIYSQLWYRHSKHLLVKQRLQILYVSISNSPNIGLGIQMAALLSSSRARFKTSWAAFWLVFFAV